MSIQSLQDSVAIQTDFSGLNRLRHKAIENDPEALRIAAQQFEGIFLNMMLKSMRSANEVFGKDSLFNSHEVKFYQEMFDQQLSSSLSNTNQLGLAEVIVRQLSKRIDSLKPPQDLQMDRYEGREKSEDLSVGNSKKSDTSLLVGSAPNDTSHKSSYIDTVMPIIDRIAKEYDINSDLLIAQSGLETGWGRSIAKGSDGKESNNLFGIKASSHWKGDVVSVETTEFINGQPLNIVDKFRGYDDLESSIRDYLELVSSASRYNQAWNSRNDPKEYFEGLQKAGYATDPRYAEKLISVYESL